MINITTNLGSVSASLIKKMQVVASRDSLDMMSREMAFSIAGEMRTRIHEQGKDSSGAEIGNYSPEYMRVRTDQLPQQFTRGEKKGDTRPKFNRIANTKVVASLTRQMENDMTAGPIKTTDGYGIGFRNSENYNKSQFIESTYNKKVFALTEEEKKKAKAIAEDFINRQIQKI